MSVDSSETLERSMLEGKDREQLLAIAAALGVKGSSRAKKADIIDKIIAQTSGAPTSEASAPARRSRNRTAATPSSDDTTSADAADTTIVAGGHRGADTDAGGPARPEVSATTSRDDAPPPVAPDTEPPAEWEIEFGAVSELPSPVNGDSADADDDSAGPQAPKPPLGPTFATLGEQGPQAENREGSSRRRRRNRNRDRRPDGPQGPDRSVVETRPPERFDEPVLSTEPVAVSGYLDLREEGYGFLRVNGYLPSRDDVYISVKQTRQYGLRKGDHVTGMSRPAARNEKNPALLRLDTVNGGDPDAARNRPRFEDLTPLFPDERLTLETPSDPTNMTARIIDLISPIGKGQRGLVVSPPKAGKTFVLKTIATAIERNNPEVKLMVLLIDERPEEVTDMRRTVKGEVISSTFDRPSAEHTHVAELAIEKAKRLVEMGHDVVVVLDGITRLSRAYNLAAPATGRIMSGGIDAGALYPPKKFFGAARNIEEGGSLTILATALVETNSRMDDAIFEEFKGTGNMELRLDRKLAERRIYPAIDVDASSTRHEELLFDRKQLQQVWKLRRVLSGLAADGSAEAGLNLLVDRLKTFRSNDDFLTEIAKQGSAM